VCYFSFKKQHIKSEIIKGNIYPDGKKSKNFFVIDDPKNICKEYNFTYKSGIEGHRYIFDIKNNANLDYLEMLIKQKYNQVFWVWLSGLRMKKLLTTITLLCFSVAANADI